MKVKVTAPQTTDRLQKCDIPFGRFFRYLVGDHPEVYLCVVGGAVAFEDGKAPTFHSAAQIGHLTFQVLPEGYKMEIGG